MKDAYYFPHDSNAKDDPKVVMLIEQLGPEGYGIYWILIETLRDQPNYRYPLNLLPALARRYITSKEKIETVVHNYNLFEVENEELFLSPSLCRRMGAIDNKRRLLSEAGKKGRAKQLQQTTGNAKAKPGPSPSHPGASKGKERKGNKRKEEDIKSVFGVLENVSLASTEKTKLDERFGSSVNEKIDALSEYMSSTGKSYKSHYATILSWDRRDSKKVQNKPSQGSGTGFGKRIQ